MKCFVFNGNCQLKALSETYPFIPFEHPFLLSFRAGEQAGPGLDEIKADLLRFVSQTDLRSLIRYGGIGISIPTRCVEDSSPDVLVLNLFHKRALYTHRDKGYTIACKLGDLRRGYPDLAQYVETHFTVEYQSNERYFEELFAYASMLRSRLPSARLVIMKRIMPTSYPGLSKQWIHDWSDIAGDAATFYERCEKDLGALFIDTDAILRQALDQGRGIDEFFPFQAPRIRIDEGGIQVEMERDLEHGTSAFWELCALDLFDRLNLSVQARPEAECRPNTFALIGEAHSALKQSVDTGDAGPLFDCLKRAVIDSDCIDLTNFFVAAALLFDSPEIDTLIDGLRGDSRFALDAVFSYLDLLDGTVRLEDRRVFVWGANTLDHASLKGLPAGTKERPHAIVGNVCDSLPTDWVRFELQDLQAEDLDGAAIIFPSSRGEEVSAVVDNLSAKVTLLPAESVLYRDLKRRGKVRFISS
jgi:hypothetical protein